MTLGQRVAVMRKGELQQVASPQELYTRPANLFVAGFIGSPGMNFFEGRLEAGDGDGRPVVTFGDGQRLTVDDAESELAGGLSDRGDGSVVVGVRPEHLEDAALARTTPPDRRLKGLVRLRELLGSELVVHFEVEAAPVVTEETRDLAEDVDAVGRSQSSITCGRRGERRSSVASRPRPRPRRTPSPRSQWRPARCASSTGRRAPGSGLDNRRRRFSVGAAKGSRRGLDGRAADLTMPCARERMVYRSYSRPSERSGRRE